MDECVCVCHNVGSSVLECVGTEPEDCVALGCETEIMQQTDGCKCGTDSRFCRSQVFLMLDSFKSDHDEVVGSMFQAFTIPLCSIDMMIKCG